MLMLGSRFYQRPVMSLQTGGRLATTGLPVIDPGALKIVAFQVEGPLLTERPAFLRIQEIREIAPMGMIVDSADDIVGLEDVISLKKLYDIEFELLDMPVIDEHKKKIGKVEDYTLETGGFVIQQIRVKRGILQGLNDTGLLIHRDQIVKVTDNEIIVKSTAKKAAEPVTEAVRGEFVNPFRNPAPQIEQSSD